MYVFVLALVLEEFDIISKIVGVRFLNFFYLLCRVDEAEINMNFYNVCLQFNQLERESVACGV